MNETKHECIVLRTRNTGEMNKIVILFSRESGKESVIAYGARKMQNRFGSSLEIFTHGNALIKEGRKTGMPTLDQMDIISSSYDLFSDYTVSAHLYYYSELLNTILQDGLTEENIFRLTIEMLRGFKLSLSADLVSAYFELWLLKFIGALPDYKICHHCKRPLSNQQFLYASVEGYLFCKECERNGVEKGKQFNGNMYNIIGIIFENKIDNAILRNLKVGKTDVTEWTNLLFEQTLEKELKSFRNLRAIREY
ncbi:MAG: DNA repair protein RecO [Acidobacteria bacterium]|nr:DNA repair protein RecO [Acidobacteriota bacterium]